MVGLCKETHTLTEAERLLRGQRGWGLGADRCATSLRVNILYRGVLLLFVAFVWRLGGGHLQLLVGMQVVFLNTLTEAGLLPRW